MIEARFRVRPEDFQVEEDLGFAPDGEGEHLLLWIEKRGANTAWVAGALARWAGVAPAAVSWSGLKDRHAVTRQWFGVHLPRRVAPDGDPEIEGVAVLGRHWHGRKLRRGSHRGNRFRIVLREVAGDRDRADATLRAIAAGGVPNAFGEQRFGHGGGNVEAARRWLVAPRPARLPAQRRALLLGAARAWLFNLVLQARIGRDDWHRGVPGDCFQLDWRGSWFGPEPVIDALLAARLALGEIHATGPLWGEGGSPARGEAADVEAAAIAAEAALADGLARLGLRQERRALRVVPRQLDWHWQEDADGTALTLAFELPAGSYATAVLAAFARLDNAAAPGAGEDE